MFQFIANVAMFVLKSAFFLQYFVFIDVSTPMFSDVSLAFYFEASYFLNFEI